MMIFLLFLLQILLLLQQCQCAVKTYKYIANASTPDGLIFMESRLWKDISVVQFKLCLNLTKVPVDQATNATSGYLGLGVSTKGSVADAEMVIGYLDNGVPVVDGYIPVTTPFHNVAKGSNSNVVNPKIEIVDGNLVLTFNRSMTQSGPKSVGLSIPATNNIVWAYGPISNKVFQAHSTTARGKLSFNYAKMDIVEPYNAFLLKTHGIVMLITWSFILLNGIYFARFSKTVYNDWFLIHRNNQMLGILFVFIGFSFTLVEHNGYFKFSDFHHYNGYIVLGLVVIQAILGFVSYTTWVPDKPLWVLQDRLHWYNGRLVFLLALCNMVYAMTFYFSFRYFILSFFAVWFAINLFLFYTLEKNLGSTTSDANVKKVMDANGEIQMEDFLGRRINRKRRNSKLSDPPDTEDMTRMAELVQESNDNDNNKSFRFENIDPQLKRKILIISGTANFFLLGAAICVGLSGFTLPINL